MVGVSNNRWGGRTLEREKAVTSHCKYAGSTLKSLAITAKATFVHDIVDVCRSNQFEYTFDRNRGLRSLPSRVCRNN